MAKILWEMLGPPVGYGIMTDLFSLIFVRWEPLACTMAGALAVLPMLLWTCLKKTGGRTEICGLDIQDGGVCIFSGIAACLAVNTLIKASGLPGIFTGFSQRAGDLYGPSAGLQICAMGVVIPLTEELIFRELGFGRLREHTGFLQAALLSSALFGLWHGNVVQGLYGFCMGIMFAWTLERKKTVAAPVLMHMAANLTSVAVTALGGL